METLPLQRRQFFRATGPVYLHVEKDKEPAPEHEPAQGAHAPQPETGRDEISLGLMNYCARLEYDRPPGFEPLLELARILERLHGALTDPKHKLEKLPKSEFCQVALSGSGMEFLSSARHFVGEKVKLTLTFPEYPFATVKVRAEVVKSEAAKKREGKFLISVSFQEIDEAHRDTIIKYVNQLQRKQMAHRE